MLKDFGVFGLPIRELEEGSMDECTAGGPLNYGTEVPFASGHNVYLQYFGRVVLQELRA